MNIAHVVLSLDCGGLEQVVVQLVKKQKKHGLEVSIICLEAKGGLAKEVGDAGIQVYELDKAPGFHLNLVFRLAKLLRKLSVDLVHSHNMGPLVYGSLAAFLTGKKCINTRHGRTDKKIPAIVWNLNSYVVPVSKDTKEYLLKHNRIAKRKINVIYNGIDLEKFHNGFDRQDTIRLKQEIGLRDDSYIIGNVGRLAQEKDQATLLKAFRKLRKKEMNVELIFVGDGPLREDLEKLVKKFELNDRVKFLGYRDDIPNLLNLFDTFVLSSYREGLSLSILEAMAAGKPVVATNVGGTREVVKERETGYLVPCGFPERIENAIARLHINPALADKMAQAGQKLVSKQFSLEAMASQYENLYNKALGQS